MTCEYSDTDWQPLQEQLYTCDIFTQTIDSPDYKIKFEPSESEKVRGLRFNDNKNVRFLPSNIAEIFPDVKALTASGTHLNMLSSNDLKGLSKLKYISFANSDLTEIEDGTFKDLNELQELDLSDSSIRSIGEGGLTGMAALKTLYLGGNKLTSLEPKTFEGLKSLDSLSLELNHLEYIDENLFSTNENLADIWLNKNKIIGLPFKVIENLPKFSYVDLQGNPCIDGVYDESNMDELKETLGEKCTAVAPVKNAASITKQVFGAFKNVFAGGETSSNQPKTEYNIDGDVAPGLIKQLVNIVESANLTGSNIIANDADSKSVECKMTDVHWKLSNGKRQTCFIQNQIINAKDFKILPADGVDGSDIKAMSFVQNKHMKYLPENIGKFAPNLEELSARHAALHVITKKNFAGLKNMKSLNLADNQIKFIDPDAFDDLVALEELDLSNNQLGDLDDEMFRKLKNLRILRIGGNNMHAIHPNLFKNLRNLVDLSISHQQISELNEHLFKQNAKLQNIWMNSNKIKSLSPNMFTKQKNLEYVDIRDNKCIDKFYDQSTLSDMKTEVLERCGKGYKLKMGVKIDDKEVEASERKQSTKKDKKKKEKVPKQQTDEGKEEVVCEYEDIFWPHLNETLKTCVINEAIDDKDTLISANAMTTENFVNGETIQAVSFGNNKNVKYLPKNLFEVFPNLVELSAVNASLTNIEPETFKSLQKLRFLDLSGNGLTEIKRETFKDLQSLEVLDLDDNDIEEFEEEVFTYIKVLRKLRMKGNKLKTIHVSWLEDMPELEEISFNIPSSVQLQSSMFEKSPKLKVIEWNDKQYDAKLNQLDTDAVESDTANSEQKEITCKYVNTHDSETGEEIEVCEIEDTQLIDNMDYVIKSSPKNKLVKKFVISGNQNVKFMPKNLGVSFPLLEEIDVEDTAVDEISKDIFENLSFLRILKIKKSKIKKIGKDTFDDLPQLEMLDMSENSLESIDDEAFHKTKNLANLKLGKNKLSSIGKNLFKTMTTLKTISLADNEIHTLDRNLFENNPSIEEIDLDGNSIDSLSPKMFDKLKQLKRISLKGNKCLDGDFDVLQLDDLRNGIMKDCKSPLKEKEISCELKNIGEEASTCVVSEEAVIDEPGYELTFDGSSIDPSQIKTFIIKNNKKIKYLPENIGEVFPNLETLTVSETSIDELPKSIFKDMPNVKDVDFSQNDIKILKGNSFMGLDSVKKLNLSGNEIEEIYGLPFSNVPQIKTIDLRGNKVKIPSSLFVDLPDLEVTYSTLR